MGLFSRITRHFEKEATTSPAEWQKLLRVHFFSSLKSRGFKCKTNSAVRIVDERIDAITVQANRHGGSCCVELGVHFTFLPGKIDSQLNLANFKAYDCEFRQRLHEPGESDRWWNYGKSSQESTHQIISMLECLQRHGFAFFENFVLSKIIENMTPQQIESGDLSAMPGATDVRTALTLSRIMKHLEKKVLSRKYAAVGIKLLGYASGPRTELEELASEN